jgi:hypothetical protein
VNRKEVFDRSKIKSFLPSEIVRDGGLVNSGALSQLAGGSTFQVVSTKDVGSGVQETSAGTEVRGNGERLTHS